MDSGNPAFDLDDAFDDNDDGDNDYKFDPNRLREDMKSLAISDDLETELPNASVSTIDIHQDTSSNSTSSFQSPNGSFVQISLSVSVDEDSHSGDESPPHDDGAEEEPAAVEDSLSADYPHVLIDASKTPSHRVTVSADTNSMFATMQQSAHASTSSYGSDQSPLKSARSLPSTPRPTMHTQQPNSASSVSDVASPSTSLPASSPTVASPLPPPLIELTSKPGNHKRYTGPTALEKFRSKTRPSHLPPKARKEDDKHMADWQTMMKQSRAVADKRRKALHDRRVAREKRIDDSLPVWQNEILPDWRVVHKNPQLRKLWWKGIPTKLRATLWERAVGNSLALSKDTYRSCLSRAKRALAAGTFPQLMLDLIDNDIASTLPAVHIFNKETGPLYADLRDMLYAWIVSRTDEGLGYVTGCAKIAAMLLLSIPAQQAFIVMRNLLERHCMRSFFGGESAKDDVEAYYRIFDTLLADGMPKIYFNFKQHQISPASYLPDWIMSLFLEHLPFEACARIWDVLLLEGDAFLFRASLGILAVLEPRLFFPDRTELLELLRGENKAALEVAKREGRSPDGGKYEIYGVDEETLWERIDSMDEWWKESTWNRLLQRELPDR